MTRVLLAAGLLVWLGSTLLLAKSRWLTRPNLAERLRPYSPGVPAEVAAGRTGVLSVASVREVISPLARQVGDRLASLCGVHEQLDLRLRRVHSPLDVTAFRVRQLALSGAALTATAVVAGLALPAAAGLVVVPGAPILAFLVVEQRLATASSRWQASLAAELPVVSEQLAMLLNAGFSLGAALNRLAARGQGCVARDLAGVTNRIRQGVTEAQALREWAAVARVGGLDRLVTLLTLNADAGDLGRLVSVEARQARRDLHRRTVELIERRAQQVWVPVTVATLVPGVILLAIPFLAALRLFSSA